MYSCASQQKRIDQAYNLVRANNSRLANLCAEQFPVHERFIKGKEITKIDTIHVAGKTFLCPPSGQKTALIRCPETKTIIKTVSKTDTIELENTARIVDLNNQLSIEREQRKYAEVSRDKYHRHLRISTWIGIISTALICLNAFLRWKLG